jgi:uncharacterized membrane protein
MWVYPAASGVLACVAGLVLSSVDPIDGTALGRAIWPGDVDAAGTLLQTVATAALTTLTMTFSVTVVALQLASQQFSPRLLRDFMRDRTIKTVLAVFVAAIIFPVTVLRRLDAEAPPPASALAVVLLLAGATVVAVVAFIHHITGMLRVDTMMTRAHHETRRAIALFYPAADDPRPRDPGDAELRRPGWLLTATTGGFLRSVDVAGLVAAARDADVVVQVQARPGDHVATGTPVAIVRRATDPPTALDGPVPDGLAAAIRATLDVGHERTIEQDAGFGFRQLVDIAVKALSPGINDPVTAAHAVGHLADLIVALTGRRLGPTLHLDAEGVGRAVVPDRDLRYYLDLACGQIRRYGRREPTVLIALLRLCRDVAVHCAPEDADEVRRQVRLVLDEMADDLVPEDAESVRSMAGRVEQALAGDVLGAYADRSGETRSI